MTEWGPSTITKISPQKGPRPVPGGEVSHGDQGHPSPLPGSRRAPSPGPRLLLLDALYADCSAEFDTIVTRNLDSTSGGRVCHVKRRRTKPMGVYARSKRGSASWTADGTGGTAPRCAPLAARLHQDESAPGLASRGPGREEPTHRGALAAWALGQQGRLGGLPLTATTRTGNSRQTPLSEVLTGRGLLGRRLTAS